MGCRGNRVGGDAPAGILVTVAGAAPAGILVTVAGAAGCSGPRRARMAKYPCSGECRCGCHPLVVPRSQHWQERDVAKWIQKLGFPQYKVISHEIQKLLDIEEPLWKRSISQPRRDPMGLFLERKAPTGPRANGLTLAEFLKEMDD
ncbi:sterile alpha motif domain-containing protein 15-like isoform X2 [Scyliorhinus canicula]|uniref:sterile alpha motif domain-containing protein 15-like isoform X2 n=1 Tax=Scyliorhinus canicula TaxID=7830 RepID=UPI0018F4EDE4|nr:sterile alpha motif domain-containing protein 15-like isoform X2 [Scyliorhinus canicula]